MTSFLNNHKPSTGDLAKLSDDWRIRSIHDYVTSSAVDSDTVKKLDFQDEFEIWQNYKNVCPNYSELGAKLGLPNILWHSNSEWTLEWCTIVTFD